MQGTEEPTEKKGIPPETAEKFVKLVRRRTQRKFSAEDKIRIVIESFKREISVAELCRREGVSTAVFYNWLKAFMEGGKGQLKGDSRRNATKDEVGKLKRENEQLKSVEKRLVINTVLRDWSIPGSIDVTVNFGPVNFGGWHLILQTVSDLTEVDRPLSPVAVIREARNGSARLSLIGTLQPFVF